MGAVLVTGATGTVGAAVADHLLRLGEPVLGGVRRDDDSARLPPGVPPRTFRFGAAAAKLADALEGVDRLFLMRPPALADVATWLFPAVDAARRRGVRHVVFLSLQGVQWNRRTPHHAVESYLRATGAPWTFLRPGFFMQNLSTIYATQIREHDRLFVPAGASRTAFVDARDVGRVAAHVLTRPGHLRKAHTLAGEQSLTYRQVAVTMSEVLGRPIAYARPSEAAYLAHLVREGTPDEYVAVQRTIHRIVRLNASAVPDRSVRRLTGEPATTLARFVQDYRSAWEPAAGG